jgi:hypothetical protein
MSGVRVNWNPGMLVATVLLVAGGALMLWADEDRPALQTVGLGVVILAMVVYLGSRIVHLVRGRRS